MLADRKIPLRKTGKPIRGRQYKLPSLPRILTWELLEDRRMLAAVSWVGGANGNWNVAANWSDNAVPAATADVTINTSTPATVVIQSGDNVTVKSLNLGVNDSLSITGGQLATTAGLTNSGAITVAAGCNVTVGGALVQSTGGNLSLPGGGIRSNPTTNLATNSDFEASRSQQYPTLPAGWSTWGAVSLSNKYARTGLRSLQLSGANSGAIQTFAATPGVAYTASADAMTPSNNPLLNNQVALLQLLFVDATGNLLSSYTPPNSIAVLNYTSAPGGPLPASVGSQGWNHFSTTAVAPANAASAQLIVSSGITTNNLGNIGTGGGVVYWDNAQIGVALPGPSSVTAGSIINSGGITVGPTNTVVSNSTFVQTSSGLLDIQLGSSAAAGYYGMVNVAAAATFAGTLKAEFVYGYTATNMDRFVPIGFNSGSGNFSNYSLPSGTGFWFGVSVTYTNVVISAVSTTPATAVVDTNSVIRTVNANVLGVNLPFTDPNSTTPATRQLVAAAGLNLFRFPGGSATDDFHFNIEHNLQANAISIPQFALFVESVGGASVLSADYGSGSPQEAAAELAYLQGLPTDKTVIGFGIEWNTTTKSWQNVNWGTVGYWASLRAATPLPVSDGLNFLRINHPAPFTGARYWEIGNEQYGKWEYDYHGRPAPGGVSTGAAHDPATYAAFAAQFSTLAAEITATAGLPAISIGIDSSDPTGVQDNNWTRNVLNNAQRLGFVPGFISDHNYFENPTLVPENDGALLSGTTSLNSNGIRDWSIRYAVYQNLLTQSFGADASRVQLIATEYNSVNVNAGKQTTSLVNGLFVAKSIGSLLTSGYLGAQIWTLRAGYYPDPSANNSNFLYGWRRAGDYGILGAANGVAPFSGTNIAYPDYYGLQLASKIAVQGGQVVSATSNNKDLAVYAVKQANGHLSLLVVNTNPVASISDQFTVSGYQPSSLARVWQYGKAQDAAQSQSTDGASGLAQFSTYLNITGNSFSYLFPSYSMTVLDLAPPPVVNGPSTVTVGNFRQIALSGANALSLADPAAGASTVDTVTLNAQGGTIKVNLTGGASISAGANGSSSLVLTGTVAQLNAALGTLIYNAPATADSDLLTVSVNDGSTVSNTLTVSISCPAFLVINGQAGFATPAGPWFTSILPGYSNTLSLYSLTDGATAKWSPRLTPGYYQVSFYNIVYPGSTTTAQLNVFANGTNTTQSLRQASGTTGFVAIGTFYFNGSGAEYVSVTQHGPGVLRANVVQFVKITTNLAPIVNAPSTQTTAQGIPLTFTSSLANGLSVADPDGGNSTEQLTLTATNGTVTLPTLNGLTITAGANNESNLTVQGTLAALNSALNGLIFAPAYHYAGAASLRLLLNDLSGLGGGPLTATQTVPIKVSYSITAINVGDLGYTEPTGTWALSGLTGANNSISRYSLDATASSLWTPTLIPGYYTVSFYNVVTPTTTTSARVDVIHNGTTDSQQLNQAIGNSSYTILGTFYFNGAGGEGVRLTQLGSGALRSNTVQFARVPANQAPTVTAPSAAQTTNENVPLTFSSATGNAITVSDPDGVGNPEQLTLIATNGTVTLGRTNGLTFVSGTNGQASFVVNGTLADLNTALDGLRFTPTTNYDGSASLLLKLNDMGNTGAGGPLNASTSIPITIPYPVFTMVAGWAGYAETSGAWYDSGLTGYNGTPSRWSDSPDARATWTPPLAAGYYSVAFYNIVSPNNTSNATVSILANGTTTTRTINQAAGSTGFVTLGTFYFSGSGGEGVSLVQNSLFAVLRASVVQFVKVPAG